MTALGAILSTRDVLAVDDHDLGEATGQSTTSATLEDITGTSVSVTLDGTGSILACMTVETSTMGGSPATGAWAISINSVDGQEIARYLSGTNDTESVTVQARVTGLGAGTYTVVERHRRISGASTVNSDVAQVMAVAVAA